MAGVRAIRASDVRRFLRRRLVGANVVLSIVGDQPFAELKRVLAKEFRGLAQGTACRANGARVVRSGEVRLRRSGLTQLYLNMLFAVPPARRALLALGLALEIVGTDPDGRLYHEVREKSGLSYDLWADLPGGAGWAALAVGAVAERRLRRAIERVFETAAREGFRKEEIARARRKVRYRYARLAEAKLDRAAAHAASILYGAPRLDEAESIVRTLRGDEIEAAWRRALRGPRLTGVLTAW